MTDEEKKQYDAEVKKAADDAAAAARKEEQDKNKADLAKQEDELKKLREKDMNFEKTRNQVTEKEKEIEDLKKRVEGVEKAQTDSPKKRMIGALANGNADLQKKIEEAYSTFSGEARTEEEIEDRVKKAYTIASGSAPKQQDVSRMVNGAGGGHNRVAQVNSDGPIDPKLKQGAEAFNKHISDDKMKISDEDLKNPKFKVKPGQSAESEIV